MRPLSRVALRAPALVVVLVVSCRRGEPAAVDAAPAPSSISSAPSASAPHALPTLDDRCTRHADCEPIFVFVDGDARCCPAPSAQAAARVTAASAFLATCAELQKTRDCPVPDTTSAGRVACVAGHCVVTP